MTEYRRVFLDTSPFIYLLDGATPYTKIMEHIINRLREENVSLYTSTATVAEYLVIPYKKNNLLQVNDFFLFIEKAQINVTEINVRIAKQAAIFRSDYNGFKGMDALQLSAAYCNNVDIFLTNDKQLRQCKELRCVMVEEMYQKLCDSVKK